MSSYGDCPEEGQCSLQQLCPAQAAEQSFQHIMTDADYTGGMLTQAGSDTAWFTALMTTDLFSPFGNSEAVVNTCAAPAGAPEADINACNAIVGEALETEDDCLDINTTVANQAQVDRQACVYESSVTLPPALAAIGNADAIQEYTEFTCSRNLPHCVDGEMNKAECLAACEAVSNKIAAYSAECLALEADEEWAIDTALNLTNATNSTNSTFPKTFECFTLGGSRSLPAGYDADGNRLGNGCAEPWCHQPHPSGPEGTGTPGSPQYQGWQRDCDQLCGEAESDLLDVVAGVTEACVDDVTDTDACDTSAFAAGTVARTAAEANCGSGCSYTAYAAPLVTDARTQTTQTSTINLNERSYRVSSAGTATPVLAVLAVAALTRLV